MRFSRRYEQTEEFRSRCPGLDFSAVAHAVVEIALSVRKTLGSWWNQVRPIVKKTFKKPEQLALNLTWLESIATT